MPTDSATRGGSQPAPYRESTLAAIVFGIVIGAVMNASITYAGLKIGFTIGGSTIAAVLGFGVLRGILRRGSILETNIGQTVASAVNIPNSGIIFTVPVLLLIDPKQYAFRPDTSLFWILTLACIAGAILGCAFIIPVRKQMIDIDRLRFPTGTAVAAILKAPGAGATKSILLLLGVLLAVVIYLPAGLPTIKLRASLEELDGLVDEGKIAAEEAELTRQIAGWVESKQLPPELVRIGREQDARIEAEELSGNDVDRLALTVYRISEGQEPWSALVDNFWARKPLWGYSDLNWRLHDPRTDPSEPLDKVLDRNDDGKPDLILTDDTIDVGRAIGLPDQIQFMFAIAPFALGAGYITGRAGLLVLAGGVLAFFVLNPVAFQMGWTPENVSAAEVPEFAFGAFNRPLGIGMLLGGALMGMLASLPSIKEALKSLAVGRGGPERRSEELGLGVLLVAAVLALVGLFVATDLLVKGDGGWLGGLNGHLRSLMVAFVCAVWIWFGGIIIAQCTGMTDWSPISGMALLTVVLVMMLAGTQEVAGAVLIGAAMCVAITCAADMMQDLKTGHLVGARPVRQQKMELLTTGLGPLVTMATILLIVATNMKTTGKPIGPGTETTAPQAQALEAVITGVQGGDIPYALYGLGAILGGLLGLGSFAGLGVLVGLSMYLPIIYILTYGIGCLINMAVVALMGKTWAEEWGVPFAAGLIVGESILALGINAVVLAMG
jgi:uncharacterized oligopeptide transporter (OPT) family protein